MTGTIGWYIHHHGGGHLARFRAVRPHVDADVVCFSSLREPENLPARTRWVQLQRDDLGRGSGSPSAEPTANDRLHWAPLQDPGHRHRLARIAHESLTGLTTMVVDVSVEVAVFARLLGLRVVLFTQPGDRTDAPHELAFGIADRIVAPWPEALYAPAHLRGADVVYVGGITRFDGRNGNPAPRRPDTTDRSDVLVFAGSGGTTVTRGSIDEAAAAAPGTSWTAIGLDDDSRVADPWPYLVGADVVVSFAGQNSVADLAAADARAIVLAQSRPFDEQMTTARILERAGLAITQDEWPSTQAWPEMLDRAKALRPDWSAWGIVGAAQRAARAIEETAGRG